jgi:hypothetical protein
MAWDWGQQRLLEELREHIANGATSHDILDTLDEEAWGLPDAARALGELLGLDREVADQIVAKHPAYAAVASRNSELYTRLHAASNDMERVLILLRASEGTPENSRPGASDQAIDALGTRLGIVVPDELRAWLRLSNGSLGGYGGYFGVSPQHPVRDIEDALATLPQQFTRTWLPIASDGCGSLYVLALRDMTSSGPAVLFLDWEDSRGDLFNVASYAVASGIWPFLRLQLMHELDLLDWHWPFDREQTLREDPALVQCVSAPLPWDAG